MVKLRWSYLAIVVVGIVMLLFRFSYPREDNEPLKVTTWDAFGYYMYNPSIFIYGDVSELKWIPEIEKKYSVTGGELYQATPLENGKYTNKYLGGVAIMQLPFFFLGHVIASVTDYPADGFSAPYQYSIAFGAIVYCILGFLLLRHVLSRFYDDKAIGITLLLLGLGTNLIQYTSIDGGQSHAYIFPLYSLILWGTIKWHERPHWKWAALIGFTIGLATICRPTELIMLFIPLLWNTHERSARKEKWKFVRKHLPHLWFVIGFGIVGILPQLMYWLYTTGSPIHNVGSKWFFFNPWFRVLFGVNNGFFIYTPIVILFIVGFFFMKKYPFRRSVITFCLLNIWIIISWSDWRYGATYSTRAMVQSYPVFALAMCAAVTAVMNTKFLKKAVFVLSAFLLYVNIFQITQYNSTVLHPHDMTWQYYGRIFLNSEPTSLDFSLLDGNIIFDKKSKKIERTTPFKEQLISTPKNFQNLSIIELGRKTKFVSIMLYIEDRGGAESNYISAAFSGKEIGKVRLKHPHFKKGDVNMYEFHVEIPKSDKRELSVNIVGWAPMEGYFITGGIAEFR